jgi:uncharacterized protein
MTAMFARRQVPPDSSFFLLGPRGTGKSTWLRTAFPQARWYDLLHTEEYVRLVADPSVFRREIEALTGGGWVVVDEVQRIPILLNEVHSLIARLGDRWRFALCGSSARKLRRLDVNLLAGRAINRAFFPLAWKELGERVDVDDRDAIHRAVAVYTGSSPQQDGPVRVLPVQDFCASLDQILG